MQGGEARAETERASGEQDVLHGGIDRGVDRLPHQRLQRTLAADRALLVHEERHDEHGCLVQVLGEVRRRFDDAIHGGDADAFPWRHRRRHRHIHVERALVVALDHLASRGVFDDEEVPALTVRAGRGADRRVEDLVDQLVGHRIGLEIANGTAGMHRLEYADVVAHGDLLEWIIASSRGRWTRRRRK